MKRTDRSFRRTGLPAAWLIGATGVLLLSCSDDSNPAGPTTATGGAGGGGGSTGTGVDVTISVLEQSPLPDPDWAWPPIDGATVAIDFPDGHREEMLTDSNGEVLVENVDLAAGKLRFTAHKPGYWVWSDELPEGESEWSALLQALEPPEMVTVSGTATNMADEANYVSLSVTTSNDFHEARGPDFSLEVSAGRPFTLVGFEFQAFAGSCNRCVNQPCLGWHHLDHPAVSADTTLEIDLSGGEPGVTTSGAFQFPEGRDSVLLQSGVPYLVTYSHGGSLSTGFMTSAEYESEANQFVYTAVHYDFDQAERVVTAYMELDQQRHVRSALYRDGYPVDGEVIEGLLLEPEFVVPTNPNPAIPSPMSAGVEWIPDESTDARLVLARAGVAVWTITARGGVSSIEAPQLPSSADATDLLGTELLDAAVYLLADSDGGGVTGRYRRAVICQPFKMSLD